MARPKHSPAQQERPIRVLSASADIGLSQSRALLLQQFGFDAIYSKSKQHALELIEKAGFDVLVFGSTLDRDTCWELAETFRKHNSEGRVIEILPSPWAAPKNRPDATIISLYEPTRLVDVILGQVCRDGSRRL